MSLISACEARSQRDSLITLRSDRSAIHNRSFTPYNLVILRGPLLPPYREGSDPPSVDEKSSKSKPLFTIGGVGLGCLLIAVLVLATPLGWFLIPLNQGWSSSRNRSEYGRNQEFYDAVIRRIETDLSRPGDKASYRFPKTPEDLKRIDWSKFSDDDRYWFARNNRTISAQRLGDGRLKVSFETHDMGHAGFWYLLYLSGDLPPDDLSPADAQKVAPHWWAVEDHSG